MTFVYYTVKFSMKIAPPCMVFMINDMVDLIHPSMYSLVCSTQQICMQICMYSVIMYI